MSDHHPPAQRPEAYGRILVNIGSVFLAVLVLCFLVLRTERPEQPAPAVVEAPKDVAAVVKAPAIEAPRKLPARPKPAPPAPPAPVMPPRPIDRAAVAQAEASLDAASGDRARAEARADEAARLLAAATERAAVDASLARKLAYTVRDPSSRLTQVAARGAFLRADRDRLKDEVAALRKAPRPRAKLLTDKNPVAKATSGEEYHFELRRNRVTFIEMDRLLELVRSDVRMKVRREGLQQTIESHVGPVGAFSMQYVLGFSMPLSMSDVVDRRRISVELQGWELVPEFEGRGETYEQARLPSSEFARAINRLNPGRATVTMWIYPDGFALYRKLRDDLHARGYLVAARPLPEGMTIRGSPAGSVSAGQ